MSNTIISIEKNSFQWHTEDPFIITMHHHDEYPEGNEILGPVKGLEDRQLGNDFSGIDGFSMYHGRTVPGFPVHPHRGFETVTIVLEGFVDHFDSTGASGRYGQGDVQWLTTGKGCQHTEMFPLINTDRVNTLELFQIWLNLPSTSKFVEPDYKMLWHEQIPIINRDGVEVKVIAGTYEGHKAVKPTAASWAADDQNHVRLLLIKAQSETTWTIPKVNDAINRNLYFYNGSGQIMIDGKRINASSRVKLDGNADVVVEFKDDVAYLLLMEGIPISEEVVAYGPFVMNTHKEIQSAINDYNQTQFGGWPWDSEEPVFPRDARRIALHADGRKISPYDL